MAFCRTSKWALRILGFWPEDPIDRFVIVKMFVNLSVLLIAIVGELRFSWFLQNEPLEALDALCPSLTKIVTCMKLGHFLVYRKKLDLILKELFNHLQEDANCDEKKNSEIRKTSFLATIWCFTIFIFSMSTSCLFIVKPLLVWAYHRLLGDQEAWVSLPFQAALPYEDMTQINNKVIYSFVYFLLAHSGNVTVLGIAGVDGGFLYFSTYLSVSYKCLQLDLKEKFRIHTSNGQINNSILYHDISELIKRQQNILQMTKELERIYKLMIFGHFFLASITMGVVLINFSVTSSGISKMIYLTYAMGSCAEIYSYCYGAESLNSDCMGLSEALYFCDWYKCDKKIRLLVLIVLAKLQEGSTLRGPFFAPSLELFATIIRKSGSYFTLLQTFL